ncbi:MAG: S8 family serine peptidase [Candidatus Nanoarchaeia archaeon]
MKNSQVREIVSDYIDIATLLNESVSLINADDIWNIQIEGTNITGAYQAVCIIDSGVNSPHPDLADKVLNESCFCDSGDVNGTGCCPDGNYKQEGVGSALDDNGHGTHVAGIVVANGPPKGVAFDSKIIVSKVLDENGTGHRNSDINDAMKWCISNKEIYNVSVISMSLGTYDVLYESYCDDVYEEWSDTVNDAITQDIFVDAASGNNGNTTHISAPACIEDIVAVGAITKSGYVASYSNRNNITDVFAPGSDIISLRWSLNDCIEECSSCSGYYMTCSGTSMAAPHIAGVAALMKQANNSLTPAEIKDIMIRTG